MVDFVLERLLLGGGELVERLEVVRLAGDEGGFGEQLAVLGQVLLLAESSGIGGRYLFGYSLASAQVMVGSWGGWRSALGEGSG